MIASFANDRQAGPGNGLLMLGQSGHGPGPCDLAIQRSSDHAFLAPGGEWKSQKNFLALKAVQAASGLAIPLGPDLTDQLATSENYRIILRDASGGEIPASLRIDEIIYSPAPKADNTPMARCPEETPPPPPTPESAADSPEMEPALLQATDTEILPSPHPAAIRKGRGAALWLTAGGVALGCALLGFFIYSSMQPAESASGAPQPARTSPAANTLRGPEERVRIFFEQGSPGGADAAMALAEALPRSNASEQDAIYRLYYYAAGQGNSKALAAYARCLDPSLPAWGSIQKDAPLAWQSYAAALSGGGDGAAMRHMRAWLEKSAAEGNTQAARWLAELPVK